MPEASPSRPSRRMQHHRAAAVLSCALLLGTAACASPDGDAPRASTTAPSAAATDEPIFASDEEALAAAVEAHEIYAAASTKVANDGGKGVEAVTAVVSPEFGDAVEREFEALRESGLRLSGQNIYYNPRLDDVSLDADRATVSVIFCRDVSGSRLVRSDGSDATPADRDLIQATRVEFVSAEPASSTLIVNGAERWQDEEGC